MKAEDFDLLVDKVQNRCKRVLVKKAAHYAGDEDRLENFKRVAQLQDMTPADASFALMSKHIVSIAMLLEEDPLPSKKQWDEKITDAINYLILTEACLIDMGVE